MTDDMKPCELVRVEQCDRDAAYNYLCAILDYPSAENARNARADNKPLVQAFARHRIEAHASTPEDDGGRRWRHVKRGTEYVEIGRAELQATFDSLVDGSSMVVYRGADGRLWVREESEFEDGRFVELRPLPDPPIRSRKQEPRA